MRIKGLQKLTLIDYPGKIACTIFLQGCNFKCGFCHNPELVLESFIDKNKEIDSEEILEFLKKRKKYLEAVCITGGEPLISLDIDFLNKIKDLGYLIKIDTNGCFPERLQEIINLGLVDFVSMDIKSSKENYPRLTGVLNPDFEKIEKSIKIISKLPEHEFRTTILEEFHSRKDIGDLIDWISKIVEKGKIQKFVFQGFKNNGKFIDSRFSKYTNTSEKYLLDLKELTNHLINKVEVRV